MHLPGAPPEIRRGPGRFQSPVFSAWIISLCCLQTLTMHLFRAAIRGISMFVMQAFRCRCQPAAAYADSCFPTCRQTASLTPQQMLPQLLCKAVYACPPVTGTARHALHSTGYSFTSIPRLSSSCPSSSLPNNNLSPALRSPAPLHPVLLYSCLAVPLSCCNPGMLYTCPYVQLPCCTPVFLLYLAPRSLH